MQITIDVPDNLPSAIVQQYLKEFEDKLKDLQSNDDFKIDEQACLEALAQYNRGDKSDFTKIGNVGDYIRNLKNELS